MIRILLFIQDSVKVKFSESGFLMGKSEKKGRNFLGTLLPILRLTFWALSPPPRFSSTSTSLQLSFGSLLR